MIAFERFATFITHPEHQELFRSKTLITQWARTYPMIFDTDDIRIAESQADLGYHFFEWLAAILVYHLRGYLSLIEQYQFKNHSRKQAIIAQLANQEILDYIQNHPAFGHIQCPDLLVYSPDMSDWFFCEVKSPSDVLQERQAAFFHELSERSGKPVRTIEFRYL